MPAPGTPAPRRSRRRWAAPGALFAAAAGLCVWGEGRHRLAQPSAGTPIAVQCCGKWGFVAPNGVVALPFEWDEATQFSDGLAWVRRGETWSRLDANGNAILPN